ncbi:MAG: DNA translocase FtsK 4TM domain-containing protein, partial [Planctomycetota bacterium]
METQTRGRIITGLALLAGGTLLFASLVTNSPYEGPFPGFTAAEFDGNACGIAGAYVSAYALALLGWTSYLLAVAMLALGLVLVFRLNVSGLPMRGTGLALLAVATLLGLAILNASPASTPGSYRAGPGVGGGVLGILLAGALYRGAGSTGTFILFLFSFCLALFLLAGAELAALFRKLRGTAVGLKSVKLRRARPDRAVRSAAAVVLDRTETPLTESLFADDEDIMDATEEIEDEPEEEMVALEPEPIEPEVITRYTRVAQQPD